MLIPQGIRLETNAARMVKDCVARRWADRTARAAPCLFCFRQHACSRCTVTKSFDSSLWHVLIRPFGRAGNHNTFASVRHLPRKRWSKAQRESRRGTLCTKCNIPGSCDIFLFDESSTSHTKVVQRFLDRECKRVVVRSVAPNLFRRMYSVAWPNSGRTSQV